MLTAFASGLARQLAPQGREQAMVRLAGGLLLTLAILRPLAGMDWQGPALTPPPRPGSPERLPCPAAALRPPAGSPPHPRGSPPQRAPLRRGRTGPSSPLAMTAASALLLLISLMTAVIAAAP